MTGVLFNAGKNFRSFRVWKNFRKTQNLCKKWACKKEISKIKPKNNIKEIKDELDKTKAMEKVIVQNGNIDIFGLYDLKEIIAYVRKKGILEPFELLKVLDLLRLSNYLKEYGENIENPYIKDLFDRISTNDFIKDEIERSIISEDEIADNASANLRSIRKKWAKKKLKSKTN